MARVAVIGSGSWGTALALVLAQNEHAVTLFGRNAAAIEAMRASRINSKYLPGAEIPEAVTFSSDLRQAVDDCEFIIMAVPSHGFRATLGKLKKEFKGDKLRIVNVAKGLETKTLLRMEEVAEEVLHDCNFEYVMLGGPSHAEEVSRGIPSTVVAVSHQEHVARAVQKLFMTPTFRVYSHSDVIGAEIGSATKNVIALAAGICDGVGFGDNTKAALITRGLSEISRLGVALKADPVTFSGLTGMGDLIVTCMSQHSRNRYVGEQIGRGKTLDQILSEMQMVAEGVRTTEAAYNLSRKHNVEMPIIDQVYAVLFQQKNPRDAVKALMTREAKAENWGP